MSIIYKEAPYKLERLRYLLSLKDIYGGKDLIQIFGTNAYCFNTTYINDLIFKRLGLEDNISLKDAIYNNWNKEEAKELLELITDVYYEKELL